MEHLIHWCRNFETFALLDTANSKAKSLNSKVNFILGVGVHRLVSPNRDNFASLKEASGGKWLMGFMSYDLKNECENLKSENPDYIGFPDMMFFEPEHLIICEGDNLEIRSHSKIPDEILNEVNSSHIHPELDSSKSTFRFRLTKDQYINTFNTIKDHIQRGNVYEINFCHELYNDELKTDPFSLYSKMRRISEEPFSSFVRFNNKFLMCSSPERFMKKEGQSLLSQPIKGTVLRGANKAQDMELMEKLKNSEKDKSENVMIVDLVRNDLGRIAEKGSVKVDELFGVYSFSHVHQMISSISCKLNSQIHPIDALKSCFPMGSMTGAPKHKAMELIEELEKSKRGIYSGAVGYITPEMNFDFNVVIRSLAYNAESHYGSFMVGGAITFNSKAEEEWEETVAKAKGLMKLFRMSV